MRGTFLALGLLLLITCFANSTHISGFLVDHPDPLIRRIENLFSKGKSSRAIEEIERILENKNLYSKKTVAYAYLRLGLIFKQKFDYDNALFYYRKALEYAPDSDIGEDAKTAIATIYFLEGNFEKAEAILREIYKSTKSVEQLKHVNFWLKNLRRVKAYSKAFGPLYASCGKFVLLAAVDRLGLPITWNDVMFITNSEKGLSLADIKRFLESKGVPSKIVKADLKELLRDKNPKIILTKDGHYLLLLGKDKDLLAFIDPAKGRSIELEHFEIFKDRFSGYAIVFTESVKGNYKEVDIKYAEELFGARCPCCPPSDFGDREDNPNVTYDASPPGNDCNIQMGYPLIKVNMVNLDLIITDTDFRYKHYGIEVKFKRTYDADSPHKSIFGLGWSWYYGSRLVFPPNSSRIDLYTPTGRIVSFYYDSFTGEYVSGEADIYDRLVKEGNRYILYRKFDSLKWIYDEEGKLVEVRDKNGNAIFIEYSDNSEPFKPSRIIDSSGREVTFEYDSLGYVTKINFFNGTSASFSYEVRDINGEKVVLLKRSVDVYGTVIEYEYDERGYLVGMTTPSGKYTFGYNSGHEGIYISTITFPNGAVKEYILDASNHTRTFVKYPDGVTLEFRSLQPGWTYEISNDKGLIVRYAFINGLKAYIYDQYGNRISIEYDPKGNISKIIYPDGSYELISFNEFDLPTYYRDRNGNVTEIFYDERGNISKIVYPDGRWLEFTSDKRGLITSLRTNTGKEILVQYDKYGYPSLVKLPSGKEWKLSYNITGDLLKITDPEGNTYTYKYDQLRRITRITDPEGNTYTYLYNHLFLEEVKDPQSKITRYFYDALDNLIKVCREGECYEYRRNEAGRVVGLVDFLGNLWTILRDEAGFYNGIKDPLGNVIEEYYDNKGNIIYRKLPTGDQINFFYDSNGRVIKIDYGDGYYESFSYDPNGNIITAQNNNTLITYTYDQMNRPTSIQDSSLGISVNMIYNEDGFLGEILYPEGTSVMYKYDEDGNISKIIIDGLSKIDYEYNKKGLLSLKRFGDSEISYTYDKRGLPLRIKLKTLKDEIKIDINRDKLGRVVDYTLSTTLNMESSLEPFFFTKAQYDKASQILSLESQGKKHTFKHDKMGNLVEWKRGDITISYEYGNDMKLRRVKQGGKEVQILYSPLGYRWKKITGGRVYEYFYGPYGNLLYERIKEGDKIKEERMYIYIPRRLDRPEAMVVVKGGERKVYYYFHNHQGSVIALVDWEGNIVNVYDYWADGNLRYISEEIEQPFLYTGAYYDGETNLYYLRARYYSPELRRFIQRDPILFEGGINLYSYTGCDFVNWGDWEGLFLKGGGIGFDLSGHFSFVGVRISTYFIYKNGRLYIVTTICGRFGFGMKLSLGMGLYGEGGGSGGIPDPLCEEGCEIQYSWSISGEIPGIRWGFGIGPGLDGTGLSVNPPKPAFEVGFHGINVAYERCITLICPVKTFF